MRRVLRAVRAGLPGGGEETIYARHAGHLPQHPGRRVVVVAGAQAPERVREALRAFRGGELHVLAPHRHADWELESVGGQHHTTRQLWDMDRELRLMGPVDVVVDLEQAAASVHQDRWSHLFFHLAHGGAWILPRTAIGGGGAGLDSLARVAQLVAGDGAVPATHRERSLGQATSEVLMTSDVVLVRKRDHHLAALGEREAVRVLSTREPELDVSVLGRLPARTFDSGIEVVSHEADVPADGLETTFAVPEMRVRRYQGDVAVSSNSLVYSGSSVLPESFRHPFERNLRTTRLVPSRAGFGRVEDEFRPRRQLRGSYFHVDSSNSGHFGHVLTEVLSRMWAWQLAKAEIPDLKAVLRIRFAGERDPDLERRLFAGLGVAPSDVVAIDQPVWVEELVGATPMMQNKVPFYVHPDIVERVWRPVTAALREGRTGVGERVFVSRRSAGGSRSCHNTAQVEALFQDHGFVVVYPEDHDLAEQAAVFHDARVLAGFGGSALFNAMHCRDLEHLVVLNSDAYTARNEQLYAAALGAKVTYFWNTPDTPVVPGTWSNDAYTSSWTFDLDRHREALRALFGELG